MEVRERTPDEWLTYDGTQIGLPTGGGDFGTVNGQPLPDLMPRAGETSFRYSDELELTCITDVAGNRTTLDRDAAGRLRGLIQPFKGSAVCESNSSSGTITSDQNLTVQQYRYDRNGNQRSHQDARHYTETTDYDQFDQWITRVQPGTAQTAPSTPISTEIDELTSLASLASPRTSHATWDLNGNQKTFTDDEDRTTTNDYDPADRLTRVTDNADHVSDFLYDPEGNQTCSRTPKGATTPASACNPASSYSTVREYDRFSELTTVTRKATFDGGTQTISDTFDYDLNGNQTLTSAAGAERAPGEDIDPFVTLRTYDGRDRLWHERRGTPHSEDTDSEDVSRSVYEYDDFGNLRRQVDSDAIDSADGTPLYSDDGEGAATSDQARHATVFVTDANSLLTDRFLPWGYYDTRDQRHYRQHFDRDERGRVDSIDAPYDPSFDTSADKEDAARTGYSFYSNGWIATAADQRYTGDGHTTRTTIRTFHYDYDRQGNQTDWRLGDAGASRKVLRQYYPNGSLGRRMAFENGSDEEGRRYSYGFYGDGQLAQFRDANRTRTTELVYDSAARLKYVDEQWKLDRDTKYRYDEDSNVTQRWTDGELDLVHDDYDGGKSTTFDYDTIGREREMLVERSGESDRETQKTYWPSSNVRRVTRPNMTVEETYLDTQGRVRRRDRTPDGDSTKIHGYFYDSVDNRIHDDKGAHEYNARAQLVKWTRKRESGDPKNASNVAYEVTGSGALAKRTDSGDGTTTDFTLHGDELFETKTNDGSTNVIRHYDYDNASGDMTCSGASNLSGCVDGTKYSYDAFSRMTSSEVTSAPSGTNKPGYEYDGFDRRDVKCVNPSGSCAGATSTEKTEYGYLGLSEKLSSTSRADGGGTKQLYDYDSTLNRLGQDKDPTSGGTNTYRSYFTDPNGSVIGLENSAGAIPSGHLGSGTYSNRAIYDYDPYGVQEINENSLNNDAQENPFRYDGFEYDTSIATYDMQARPYRPDIARFTTADRFEDAVGDFGLQSDPLTQNRYAFGAGSPINHIEFDGHCGSDAAGAGPRPCPGLHGENDAAVKKRDKELAGLAGHQPKNVEPLPDPNVSAGAGAGGPAPSGGDGGGSPFPLTPGWTRDKAKAAADAVAQAAKDAAEDAANDVSNLVSDPPDSPGEIGSYAHGRLCGFGAGGIFPALCNNAAQQLTPDQERFGQGETTATIELTVETLPLGGEGAAVSLTRTAVNVGTRTARTGLKRATQRLGARAGQACNSFSGDTLVLLADGSKKPISEIRVGDAVYASDPETGTQGPRIVTRLWMHDDTLVDLAIGGGTVTTTASHPFWNATDREWQYASALNIGDAVLTASGDRLRVRGLRPQSLRADRAYNLTVDGIHSYFVAAAGEMVLVHNAGGPRDGVCDRWARSRQRQIGGEVKSFDKPEGTRALGGYSGGPEEKWFYHTVLVKEGRVYDQFTPAQGEPISAWKERWEGNGVIDFGF
jgi:RHS repeat-associated protein